MKTMMSSRALHDNRYINNIQPRVEYETSATAVNNDDNNNNNNNKIDVAE